MITIQSPLRYFGNRFSIASDIFSLVQGIEAIECARPLYDCFYDLFSGCGALGLAALELNIANDYVINDAYPAFQHFWHILLDEHETLIRAYQALTKAYEGKSEVEKKTYFEEIQTHYHYATTMKNAEKAAHFAFILNHAQDSEPVLNDKQQLICQHTSDIESALAHDEQFASLVKKVNALFEKYRGRVHFGAQSFCHYQDKVTSKDLVILDPPYPCTDESIYFRSEKAKELYMQLQKVILQWQTQGITFMAFYEVVGKGFSQNLFTDIDRFCHLSPAQGAYGRYVENCFLSKPLTKQFDKLTQPCFNFICFDKELSEWGTLDYTTVVEKFQKCIDDKEKSELFFGSKAYQVHGIFEIEPMNQQITERKDFLKGNSFKT